MDFYTICTREIEKGPNKGSMEVYPDWKVGRSKDLMVRGRSFYAVWDEELGLWSTDEYDVQRLVDQDLHRFVDERADKGLTYHIKNLRSFNSQSWVQFRKFMQNISDNSHPLDENLTFANTEVKKGDYVSRRLPYALEPGDHSAWDELVGTLYSVEERAKIEWTIGSIVAGDSKKIHKFAVFYGPPASGKSTILNIIEKLFVGYTTTFDAKALGGNGNSFATEVFKDNPLVAIQQDGDLSKIEDNARLNSIISHENMPMNEKYKPGYTAKVNSFLYMGTNQPVKISDAKSGIIRRLIDIHPTGVSIPTKHYFTLMARIDFELGAIAQHCLEVYQQMGKNYYNGYRPTEMMLQTDVFFNFIEANYDIFKKQDSTSLKQAYTLYKEFCNETGIERMLPQYKVREELRNYFDEFKERATIDGETIRSFYSGFNANKFKTQTSPDKPFSLALDETESIFDREMATQPAQLGSAAETPKQAWASVKTTLADIDTSQLHFVKVPENHIVIDFDLKDPKTKEKSLERNLEAATVWPATYAELSKSGAGVHLHYLYEGDTSELATLYSEGIEVKVYRGNSSLRRRLSKCNSVPISTLNIALPKKEKKVLNVDGIKTERGLREQIARNMRKEIHNNTASSVSFIKKILDEAYEKGLSYDVSDLQPKLVAFANNSTNQPIQSMKLVREMRFRGPQEEQAVNEKIAQAEAVKNSFKDDRIVFYDVEVYPNLFVICWKFEDSTEFVRMVNPTATDVENLFSYKLVGFNNRSYDNHILYAAFMGYDNMQLYKLSQKIIDNQNSAKFAAAYGLSYADIYEFSSKKQSLKKFEIELGVKHMELDIPWDKPVEPELVEKVVEYCCNDVAATEATFKARKQDFVARQILADLSGLTVNDTTPKHTARIIFGEDRNPQANFVYTDLSKEFPGYTFELGKSNYRDEIVGEGGYVYAEPGVYSNVALLDIASMHPTSIEQLNLFGDYTPNFSALKQARIAIKHGDYESAKSMLGGKLAPHLGDPADAKALSDALKIAINIVYGLTSAKFDNPFKDRRNRDNIVAKRGALFMVDLKHAVQEQGFTVAHIKTDSIKIPDATPEIIEFVTNYGAKYGYDFEHEATYDKFCLVNDAVYVAKSNDKWTAVGAQFQHPYVYKQLFSHDEVEYRDLCETKQVVQGALYLDFEHEKPEPMVERMQFVGRTGLFVPVNSNVGGVLYRVKDGKPNAATGTKGRLWLEAAMYESLKGEVDIDLSYFDELVDKAVKTIEKFGSFEELVA